MNMKWQPVALALALLASTAWAQTASKPLNLKLPPTDLLPPASSTAAAPAASSTAAKAAPAGVGTTAAAKPSAKDPPGTYYGDTSGSTDHGDRANAFAPAPPCDDASYNDAQVHGSLTTGVVGGNHVSGSYEGGEVNITKNTGSCEHPTGAIGVSIGVSQGQFHGRGF